VLQRKEPATRKAAGGQPGSDVRDYLAEERTFLAWIRTILGLMGVGFVVARIDRFSLWFGTALIAIGAALSLLAVRRHRRVVEELNRPQVADRHASRQGVFLALFLAAAGITMALYLILT
jgi:inner membrane protein YidH